MVVGSNLTPHIALLVHPSGTIHPIVDHHGQINAACERRPVVCLDSARVWSCKMNFSSCRIMPGFDKSSHNYLAT